MTNLFTRVQDFRVNLIFDEKELSCINFAGLDRNFRALDSRESKVADANEKYLPCPCFLTFTEREIDTWFPKFEIALVKVLSSIDSEYGNLLQLPAPPLDPEKLLPLALTSAVAIDPTTNKRLAGLLDRVDGVPTLDWLNQNLKNNNSRYPNLPLKISEKEWLGFLNKSIELTSPNNAFVTTFTELKREKIKDSFQIRQLTGWVIQCTEKNKTTYVVELSGLIGVDTPIESNYRLDVLGPDGGQLLTLEASALSELEPFKENVASCKVFKVTVPPLSSFAKAYLVKKPPADNPKNKISVRGRLFLASGEPIGERLISIFEAPTALKRISEECCELEDWIDQGSCSDDELRFEPNLVLQLPLAIGVGQSRDNGYFEIEIDEDEDLINVKPSDTAPEVTKNKKNRNLLIHISGVSAALAIPDGRLTIVGINGKRNALLIEIPDEINVANGVVEKPANWESSSESNSGKGIDYSNVNRALEEFSFTTIIRTTDPLIQKKTIDWTYAESEVSSNKSVEIGNLFGGKARFGPEYPDTGDLFRGIVGRDQQIRWDSPTQISEAVTIAHGRLLTVKQVWRADGYSLGDLLYSLPLAPLQKKSIVVIDWDRRDQLNRDTGQNYSGFLSNNFVRDRDINEIVNGKLTEITRGNSGSSGGGFGGGIFGVLKGIGGSLFGGTSSAASSSNSESTRTLATNSVQKLIDRTNQNASDIRNQRTSIVQLATGKETQTVTSEVVANRNASHALTIQYFEVLRHFKIEHELSAVRECLFIPLPIETFDPKGKKVLRWRDELIQALIKPSLAEGFDAIERLSLDEASPTKHDVYPAGGTRASEDILDITGELTIELDFPIPSIAFDSTTPNLPLVEWDAISAEYSAFFPNWTALGYFLWGQKSIDKRDEIFRTKYAPFLAQKLVENMKAYIVWVFNGFPFHQLRRHVNLDFTLLDGYSPGGIHRVAINLSSNSPGLTLTREQIGRIIFESLQKTPSNSKVIIRSVNLQYSTKRGSHQLCKNDRLNDDISLLNAAGIKDFATLNCPLDSYESTNLKKADEVARHQLVQHLNMNLEYYHKAIWVLMDADRRFTLLDGFIAPNSNGRSVASVVENAVVGIVGNSIVMPVAPGIELDVYIGDYPQNDLIKADCQDSTQASDRKKTSDSSKSGQDQLLSYYKPAIPNPAIQISIPTKGIFAEAVLGSSNSSEKIDESRNWRYWEHPLPDEVPSILPTSTESRNVPSADLTLPPYPQPVINQVNTTVPAAPDPTGLSGTLDLLGKSDIFRDAAGLSKTQDAAMAALSGVFDGAKKFGDNAVAMFGKSLVHKDADKTKASIIDDVKNKRISEADGRDALRKLHSSLVESGGAEKESSVLDNSSVGTAIHAAAQNGASISVKRGNSEVSVGERPRGADTSSRPSGQSVVQPSTNLLITVRYRATIPSDVVSFYNHRLLPQSRHNKLSGTFNGGVKAFLDFTIDLEQIGSSSVSLTNPHWGVTERIDINDTTHLVGKPDWFRRLLPNARILDSKRLKRTLDNLNAEWESIPECSHGVKLTVAGSDPLLSQFAPNINADLHLGFRSKNGQIEFKLYGTHDGFPNHEIWIDGVSRYQWDCVAQGRSPLDLVTDFPTPSDNGSSLITIRDPIEINQGWRKI